MSTNENEWERLEAALRKVRPARLPADFLQRLTSEAPPLPSELRAQSVQLERSAAPASVRSSETGTRFARLPLVLRWLVPATAVLAVGFIVWRSNLPATRGPEIAVSPMKADDVQIDQQLVSTFDAVAPLPSG